MSDSTWRKVRATLTDREAIEACLFVGHYQGLASTIGGRRSNRRSARRRKPIHSGHDVLHAETMRGLVLPPTDYAAETRKESRKPSAVK